MQPEPIEPHLTTRELASILRFSSAYIRQLANRGELPSVRINGELRYPANAVQEYLRARRNQKGNLNG